MASPATSPQITAAPGPDTETNASMTTAMPAFMAGRRRGGGAALFEKHRCDAERVATKASVIADAADSLRGSLTTLSLGPALDSGTPGTAS